MTNVSPGPWVLQAFAGDGRQLQKTVMVSSEDEVTVVDLDFGGPGFLVRGRLSGPSGGPLADSRLTLVEHGKRNDGSAMSDGIATGGWTDHEGVFLFGPLAPGTYDIEVFGADDQRTPMLRTTVTVTDADRDIELTARGRRLVVRGRRRDWVVEESRGCSTYSMEIMYSQFERAVELPCEVEQMKITTEYRDGMLLVRLHTEGCEG